MDSSASGNIDPVSNKLGSKSRPYSSSKVSSWTRDGLSETKSIGFVSGSTIRWRISEDLEYLPSHLQALCTEASSWNSVVDLCQSRVFLNNFWLTIRHDSGWKTQCRTKKDMRWNVIRLDSRYFELYLQLLKIFKVGGRRENPSRPFNDQLLSFSGHFTALCTTGSSLASLHWQIASDVQLSWYLQNYTISRTTGT